MFDWITKLKTRHFRITKAFISFLRALKNFMITSELRRQAVTENFENVFLRMQTAQKAEHLQIG